MGRYLIVANQTVGGAELDQRVRDRIEHGEARFYVVVPMAAPEHEVSTWPATDVAFGVPLSTPTDVSDDAMEQARERSQRRLDAMLDRIRSLGGEAEGEVGTTDPLAAVKDVLEKERFDEVIVSTLPIGISRWAKMDLPSKIGRVTDCPVTTVEAGTSTES